ncbi:hypothetical protein KGF56_000128 [Candida oxycetoniae]|uniref:DNA polymerase delta subunit 3 n=1 Tax=Candida oxycetoniae TaxID=497107 RepID=A0AAI9T1Y4_9ASCO|nr:uncharacterized protein KGF56_000128 [Candida oxycetoniae]KAI3407040.2 hypothetical protein KGF56_000128 [Candida oxycetoniae]
MEAPSNEVSYLTDEIVTKSRPILYRELSRSLSIPISKAKMTLLEYYLKNTDTLSASFVITGKGQDGSKMIKFCATESVVEDSMNLFKAISTIHVYSVQKKELCLTLNDIAREGLKIRSCLSDIEEYQRNGIIIGTKISHLPVQKMPASSPIKTQVSEGNVEANKRTSVKNTGLPSSYVSRKQQNQATPKASGLSYVSRKGEKSVPQKRVHTEPESEPAKPSYQYKSRKVEQKQPRERVIVDHNNYVVEEDDEKPRVTRPPTTKLADMFLDDEDETFEFSDDTNDEHGNDKNDKYSNDVRESRLPEKIIPEEENTNLVESSPEEEGNNDANANQGNQDEIITEVDEEGYTVTRRKPRTMGSPSSSSSRNMHPNKIVKPTPTSVKTKKTKDTNKKKTQSSLLNFFGKK